MTSTPSNERCGKIWDNEIGESHRKIFNRRSASSSVRSGTYMTMFFPAALSASALAAESLRNAMSATRSCTPCRAEKSSL